MTGATELVMGLDLPLDSVFAGRYRIVRPIAQGGMGAVYEVVHIETERRRALKVMLPTALRSAEARDRFKREAKVGALIDSEMVVDVFDAGIDEATAMPFMVMELLRGEELGARVERIGRLPPDEVVAYLHQTALALDKAHRASIVHRDIKPENLYLTEREDGPPRVKVLDFGIAKLLADGGLTVNATKSVGTPLYMAPEQYQGNHVISAATDVYALAHVAFTLLVGSAYYEDEALGDSGILGFALAVARGPQESPVARARRRGAVLPAGFDAWFFRATALRPPDRFGVATLAVQELAAALGVPRPGAPRPAGSEPAPLLPRASAPVLPSTIRLEAPLEPMARPRSTAMASAVTQTTSPPRGSGALGVGAALVVALVALGAGVAFFQHRGGRGATGTATPSDASETTAPASVSAVLAAPSSPPSTSASSSKSSRSSATETEAPAAPSASARPSSPPPPPPPPPPPAAGPPRRAAALSSPSAAAPPAAAPPRPPSEPYSRD